MSGKLKLLIGLSFVPFVLGAVLWLGRDSVPRAPSQHSENLLDKVRFQSTIHMEKHLAPIKITLDTVDEIPEGPDQEVLLKARIVSTFTSMGPLHYEWTLPSEVDLVRGSLVGVIANPTAGQPYDFEITVKNFDRQYRRQILIKAHVTDREGVNLYSRALITSRPEDSMEHLAPAMMVQAQEAKMKERLPASTSE